MHGREGTDERAEQGTMVCMRVLANATISTCLGQHWGGEEKVPMHHGYTGAVKQLILVEID